ncbi:uncharacterized protein MELLADRAFT_65117 [Melampsora larici-populina 98AG31]|uniref:Uncharacterized protein n=1 Tax=Melampsora larici-populina (strain 98AG31 / pathotype 3-4-7) TaxID=747676 RepID=F4RU20_MELLP|nr:uncharacterized protein MELLADRAFT_65117 [Melampsora larici-populina 98AG31]EGG04159.1 hypothetical protein MELLADRAFT_65117 [Melampsora larici-populina 98AG31]
MSQALIEDFLSALTNISSSPHPYAALADYLTLSAKTVAYVLIRLCVWLLDQQVITFLGTFLNPEKLNRCKVDQEPYSYIARDEGVLRGAVVPQNVKTRVPPLLVCFMNFSFSFLALVAVIFIFSIFIFIDVEQRKTVGILDLVKIDLHNLDRDGAGFDLIKAFVTLQPLVGVISLTVILIFERII